MLAVTLATYLRYVRKTLPEPPPATPPRSADGPTPLMLRPAMAGMVATHACIGLQQVVEYLAMESDQAWLYKLSLSFSLLAMFFAVHSLEHLTRRNLSAPVVGAVVVFVSIWNFFQPMGITEGGEHFWSSKSGSPLHWGAVWMVLFIYWNVCLYKMIRSAFSKKESRLLRLYGLALLNFSFFVSLAFAIGAELYAELYPKDTGPERGWPWDDKTDIGSEMMAATPVLWCVLAGLQVFLLPLFLRALRAGYVHDLPPVKSSRGALFLAYITLLALLVTGLTYYFFDNVEDFANVMVRR